MIRKILSLALAAMLSLALAAPVSAGRAQGVASVVGMEASIMEAAFIAAAVGVVPSSAGCS